MKTFAKTTAIGLLFSLSFLLAACGSVSEEGNSSAVDEKRSEFTKNPPVFLSVEKNEASDAPIGKYDFKNYTYPLPVGWQGAGIKEVTLENGTFQMNKEHVGASYVGTKFGDVTSDGREEAMVVIRIDTGGSANPQIVYIFEWKDDKPEMIWYFRTGDRADGGIKDLRAENGELVLQLYGQDRYLIGELETMRIPGDIEQICCPVYFTRTRYKWDGSVFKLQGKRETYSLEDKSAPPIENMGEIVEKEANEKR